MQCWCVGSLCLKYPKNALKLVHFCVFLGNSGGFHLCMNLCIVLDDQTLFVLPHRHFTTTCQHWRHGSHRPSNNNRVSYMKRNVPFYPDYHKEYDYHGKDYSEPSVADDLNAVDYSLVDYINSIGSDFSL